MKSLKIMTDIQEQLNKKDISHLENTVNRLEIKIDDGFRGVHMRQDRTNGNVSKNTNWRYYITGALAVLTVLVLPIFFIVIKEYLSNLMK